MSGHTPGPWIADGPDQFNDFTIHPADRKLAITKAKGEV